ncbi:hypothetical protein ACFYPT_39025 [Streptomyces sp. NPDC005529]|uniref:hypothetical protein n=1 Tax=unclassified Streptomyces TaxID=2593676 RepID=UPI0033AF4404
MITAEHAKIFMSWFSPPGDQTDDQSGTDPWVVATMAGLRDALAVALQDDSWWTRADAPDELMGFLNSFMSPEENGFLLDCLASSDVTNFAAWLATYEHLILAYASEPTHEPYIPLPITHIERVQPYPDTYSGWDEKQRAWKYFYSADGYPDGYEPGGWKDWPPIWPDGYVTEAPVSQGIINGTNLFARGVANGAGGTRYEHATDEDFTEEGRRDGEEIHRAISEKSRSRFTRTEADREASRPKAGMGDVIAMHDRYAEEDVQKKHFVLYFEPDDAKMRSVQLTEDPASPFGVGRSLTYGGTDKVKPGKYGWVLDAEQNLFFFPPNPLMEFNLWIDQDGTVGHHIPQDLERELLHDAPLKKQYGNIPTLIEKLFPGGEQTGTVHAVIKFRHSSHVAGGPVIGAGICEVKEVDVWAKDARGQALYVRNNSSETVDPATVFYSEDQLNRFNLRNYTPVMTRSTIIAEIDNDSGHYKPYVENLQNAVIIIKGKGYMSAETSVGVVSSDRSQGKTEYEPVDLTAGEVSAAYDAHGGPLPKRDLLGRHDLIRTASQPSQLSRLRGKVQAAPIADDMGAQNPDHINAEDADPHTSAIADNERGSNPDYSDDEDTIPRPQQQFLNDSNEEDSTPDEGDNYNYLGYSTEDTGLNES